MVWQGILVLCILSVAGNSNANKVRILNGQTASIEDFPYQVSLRMAGRHFCGGSIISEKHVVTAGHCVKNNKFPQYPPYNYVTVTTGSSFINRQGNSHKIAKITTHPDYETDGNRAVNDIAIITLKDPIAFDQYQQKINLPEHNYEVGARANVTGWGLIRQIPPVLPRRLQKTEAELISKEECQRRVIDPKNTEIYDTEVCTDHSKVSGVCSGDSGGPLAVNGELVGIVSWSDGDYCDSKYPNVFTNVYKFKDFIRSVTN